MRLIHIMFLSHLFVNGVNAQNLVLNGDFEEYKYCDINLSESLSFYRYKPISFYADFWYFPIPTFADYLNNNCSNSMRQFQRQLYTLIPQKDGNGVVGFNLYGPDGYFEPITGTLACELIKDSVYSVSFNLCYLKEFSEFYSKKIGIKFSSSIEVYPLPNRKEESNYVEMFEDKEKILADLEIEITNSANSTNWNNYCFKYKAIGGERYITFGMFYQSEFDLINYSRQFASVSWKKKIKSWLKLHKNTPILVFKGDVNSFYQLPASQKRLCYYLLDDVSMYQVHNN